MPQGLGCDCWHSNWPFHFLCLESDLPNPYLTYLGSLSAAFVGCVSVESWCPWLFEHWSCYLDGGHATRSAVVPLSWQLWHSVGGCATRMMVVLLGWWLCYFHFVPHCVYELAFDTCRKLPTNSFTLSHPFPCIHLPVSLLTIWPSFGSYLYSSLVQHSIMCAWSRWHRLVGYTLGGEVLSYHCSPSDSQIKDLATTCVKLESIEVVDAT